MGYSSPMQKNIPIRRSLQRYQRTIAGSTILIIAFIAAILIAHEANRTVLLWSTSNELSTGAVIQQSDLKARRALLPENSHMYFSSSADLIGAIVSHHVGAGELIPTSALIEQGSEVDGRYVPLEVAIHDLPTNVARGSIVDIYAIAKNSSGSASSESTALVAVATTVIAVDRKGDLSGSVGVVVNLRAQNVSSLISQLSAHRILLVSHV
ncbi:MAG: hypothetical protein EB046_02090 [Actinobacteria bacterium]|nr:hypothetical protein [Actinomycetota bacterium]